MSIPNSLTIPCLILSPTQPQIHYLSQRVHFCFVNKFTRITKEASFKQMCYQQSHRERYKDFSLFLTVQPPPLSRPISRAAQSQPPGARASTLQLRKTSGTFLSSEALHFPPPLKVEEMMSTSAHRRSIWKLSNSSHTWRMVIIKWENKTKKWHFGGLYFNKRIWANLINTIPSPRQEQTLCSQLQNKVNEGKTRAEVSAPQLTPGKGLGHTKHQAPPGALPL